jgi:hypothetical protein
VSSCSQGVLTCGGACGCSIESALSAVEGATAEAAKYGNRSEPLAALVAEAKAMIEQARAAEAERAKVAAEEAAAVAAVEAAAAAEAEAERLQLEEQAAALTLQLQQVQARLGSSVVPPAPHLDYAEDQCVLCFDAPKDHIILPCFHVCVCEACATLLTQTRKPSCPICRTAIQQTNKVFHS